MKNYTVCLFGFSLRTISETHLCHRHLDFTFKPQRNVFLFLFYYHLTEKWFEQGVNREIFHRKN